MINDLLLYIVILAIGIFIGYKEISHEKLLSKLDTFQMIALILILFVMGIRIGTDDMVLGSIQELGFKSLVFSVGSISFSVLFVSILRKFMKMDKKGLKL